MIRVNHSTLAKAIEKLNKNTLDIEDILDEEDLIQEMKGTNASQLLDM